MAKFNVKVTELQPFEVEDSDPARGSGLGSDQCDNPNCDNGALRPDEMAHRDPAANGTGQELSPLSK